MLQKKRDKRSIQSCVWIYEALKQLMHSKEYSKITVTDIVNQANLGRTTFYRNFDTMDDVLKMKCLETFQDFRQYCITFYTESPDAKQTFLTPFLNFWYKNSEIIELLIKADQEKIIRDSLKTEIEFFLNSSTMPTNHEFQIHKNYFIEMRIANSMSILTEWLRNNKNIPPHELESIITKQTTEGSKNTLLF